MSRTCARIAASSAFNGAILVVIVANAIVLGLETYEGIQRRFGGVLGTLNDVFLAIFVGELVIRIAACGHRPQRFFRSGWNLFDFIVIAAAFLPGLRENATLLRLARLIRVVRVVRLLPDLRVLILAVVRSVPGVASLAVLTLLLIYLYGMVGWLIYGETDPDRFGTIGAAMLTMFVLLSLENLPDYIADGQRLSEWTVPFYVSYVLLASLLILNIFIGVVINSLEEARDIEHRRQREERLATLGDAAKDEDDREEVIVERLAALREELEDLEADIKAKRLLAPD